MTSVNVVITPGAVELLVMGLPAPQGSKTYMPKQRAMVEGSSPAGRTRLRTWRTAVVEAAAKEADRREGPFEGPVLVGVTFRLPMPRSRPKWHQRLGTTPCKVKPDLDKLVRSLLDGLVQGGLLRDDAQVCELRARKVEVVGWTGAKVAVTPVSFTQGE